MSTAELLAVVEVPYDARIRCQAQGCGHAVYKRIHVVRQGDALQVLGTDCFSKIFGAATSLNPRYGGSEGRVLTLEERELLLTNTDQLLERFKAEQEAALEARRLAQRPRPVPTPTHTPLARAMGPSLGASKTLPWPWMKPISSICYFRLRDDTGWVRVQRADGQQMLVPWPTFDGWDEALPGHIGPVDRTCGGYVLRDVVEAVKYMRALSAWDKVCGSMRELNVEAARSSI